MRPITITKSLSVAADADGICASQTPAGAGNLTIDGALASGGAVTLDSARQVLITTVSDESGKTLTIYGTDEVGTVISETVTGPNATTGTSTYMYKTVTRVAVSAAFTGAVTVGTNGVGASKGVLLNQYLDPFAISIFLKFTGTVNVTVQYTSDDHRASGFHWGAASWTDHSSLTSKTANLDSNIAYPATGLRVKVNSGTGSVSMIVRQAG